MISQPFHNGVMLRVRSHKELEGPVLSFSLILEGQELLFCLLLGVVDVVGSQKFIMELQYRLSPITARPGAFDVWPGLCFDDKWVYNTPYFSSVGDEGVVEGAIFFCS